MFTIGRRSLLTIIIIFTLDTCIDPYQPNLSGYGSLLVIDGLITDQNSSYTVILSHTLKEQNGTPSMVSDAKLYITDDAGGINYLTDVGNGRYKTDSTKFRGIVGRKYVLHVETADGGKYESNECLMSEVPEIDSIYFEKDKEVANNGTEENLGIRIYLDTYGGDINKYYRWEFTETWKFKLPTIKKSTYIDEKTIIMNTDTKEYCWKTSKSDKILIHSASSGETGNIKKEPICFIASGKSDRLRLQYSILIKQFSVSENEYDFWNNLENINDKTGDIFAYQPYPVGSNMHNINNPQEQILGYFQVSAVSEKRMFITCNEINNLSLPLFIYNCERIEASPKDPPWNKFVPPLTFDEIYQMFTTSGYSFIEPKYFQGTLQLDELVFARPVCSDCELTGTGTKPDFWIDLN
jgi:hypothetical protein